MRETGRNCPQCGTKTVYGSTTLNLGRDGITITVEGVPAEVCPKCGEAYIEAQVFELVGGIAGTLIEKLAAARQELQLAQS